MKIIKNLTFAALAALAVMLLFQTQITRAVAKDKGPRGHGHTLHLRAYFTSFHSTQAGAGLAVGDQLTFGGTLARIESPNEQIGSVGAHFAVTAPGGAELLGNGCLILPDGKVSSQILIGEKDWRATSTGSSRAARALIETPAASSFTIIAPMEASNLSIISSATDESDLRPTALGAGRPALAGPFV